MTVVMQILTKINYMTEVMTICTCKGDMMEELVPQITRYYFFETCCRMFQRTKQALLYILC